ncbi:MAG: LamG domain-containing protein [Verrucomicrobiia bacterium]
MAFSKGLPSQESVVAQVRFSFKPTMNAKLPLLGVITLALVLSAQHQSQASLSDGLIAYYPFNGSPNDQSVNANNGTPINAVLTTDRFGNANAAYGFNGVNAYVSAPNKSYLTFPDEGNFSVSIWAAASGNPSTSSYHQWFLCGLDNGPGLANPKWIVYYGPPNFSNWPVENKSIGFITQDGAGHGYWLATTPNEAQVGSWHQYLVTKAGSSYTVYIDGVQKVGTDYMISEGSDTPVVVDGGPSSIQTGIDASLTIGWAEGGGYFQGSLDDIRIYNRALSSEEVQSLYASESVVPEPSTFIAGVLLILPFLAQAVRSSLTKNDATPTPDPLHKP